jgi:putative DNA primase/helicase
MKHAKDLKKEVDEEKRKKMVANQNVLYKLYLTAYKSFGSNDFCNSVIAMLPSLYENEQLEEIMDMNRDVLAFTDGLYDLKTSCFRCIMPQDYVSTTTGYEYPKSRNENARKEIMDMFWSMFEDKELIDYILKVFGTCLYGKNRFEEYYVLTGSGRNGKGVLSDFLKYTFGDYFTTVDNTLITKPLERKDQPIPALVDARPKRIMMTSEPEGDDKLQIGIIKKISGGDAVEARTLNTKHIHKYVPPYKLFIQTNNIPKLSQVQQSVQNRMRIIHFPFKFLPNPTESYHRPVNPDLKDKSIKSVEWRNEFMMVLIEKYNEVKDLKSLPAPNAVMRATNEYFDDNNPLRVWLDNHYVITKKSSDVISASKLKGDYMKDMCIDKISDIKFKELMDFNNITRERKNTGMAYVGLVRKDDEYVEEV